MSLHDLYHALSDTLDGERPIEREGRQALIDHASDAQMKALPITLAPSVCSILAESDAHPVCRLLADTPLPWCPPEISSDPRYVEHSLPKIHVELIGPDGFSHSDEFRIGLYGMLPGHEYGIRTHPAEEVFVMLAGECDWKRGDCDYAPLGPGKRSYHPSMMPHANRTRSKAFLSIYVWRGDVDKSGYRYEGIR